MAKPGRKSWIEEMKIAQRYSDLSEDYFTVLKEMFNSDDKADKKWAAQELSKAFVKMIPQDVTSGGDKLQTLHVRIIGEENEETEGNADTEGVQETSG
jgi:hypothetical protein